MNKRLKMILSLIVMGAILSTTIVRADYNVTEGITNTYDVNTSNWHLTHGANSAIGIGYQVAETSIAEGTQFDVEVTTSSLGVVYWNMTAGTTSYEDFNTILDVLLIFLLIDYPYLSIYFPWNQTYYEMGPKIFTLFFADAPYISNYFYTTFANETYISEWFTYEYWTFTQKAGHFDNSTNTVIFDWVLNSRYYDTSTNTDYSGEYYFKYAFDKINGEMKGYRIAMDYSGTVSGHTVAINWQQDVELVGYDLPVFYFKAGFIPGFEWYVAFSAIVLIGAATILMAKRKK